MARYLIRVSYDGTEFQGWQVQCAGRSIQGDLINAFRELGIRHPGLIGSGRTDAGVHALAHTAHFDYRGKMSTHQLVKALNTKLRDDVLVTGIWQVADDFHSRYQAMARSYIYLLAREMKPLNRMYTGFLPRRNITVESLSGLAEVLKGSHDFTSLSRDNPLVPNHICDVNQLEITEEDGVLSFRITADRFLHNMVRRIVGTLVNLSHTGLGKDILEQIMQERNARQRLVTTAPPQGLYLVGVQYPDLYLDETTPPMEM